MFARKHVSVIPVSIAPAPQPAQEPESITGRSMTVRIASPTKGLISNSAEAVERGTTWDRAGPCGTGYC